MNINYKTFLLLAVFFRCPTAIAQGPSKCPLIKIKVCQSTPCVSRSLKRCKRQEINPIILGWKKTNKSWWTIFNFKINFQDSLWKWLPDVSKTLYLMKMKMIFHENVFFSHTEVSKWRHFEENLCFLKFTKGNVCFWEIIRYYFFNEQVCAKKYSWFLNLYV